jgi:hypothetical protein
MTNAVTAATLARYFGVTSGGIVLVDPVFQAFRK